MIFALLGGTLVEEPATKLPTEIIPDGASIESTGINYTPEVIIVFMGLNNTVKWVNHDSVPHGLAMNNVDFSPATKGENQVVIMPGKSFEYTFTKPESYSYHAEPGPWLRGLVLVLPEIREEPHVELSFLGLQDSYNAGDRIEYTVLAEGYETGCATVSTEITRKDGQGSTYGDGLVTDCEITAPFHNLKWNVPVDLTGRPFSFQIDPPGTYVVKATYKANLPETKGMVEKVIIVR